MDNLVDSKMIIDYIKGQQGEAASPIVYGTHVDVIKYLNGKAYNINGASEFSKDYVIDALDHQGAWLSLKRPHEWSVSLAKALCLSEELFHNDANAHAYIQKRRPCTDAKN